MPQMSVTFSAHRFGARHEKAPIHMFLNVVLAERRIEARPTTTRIEFILGVIEWRIATAAMENSVYFKVIVLGY